MTFVEVVDFVARGLEGAGVAVIVIGALVATVLAIVRLVRREPAYDRFREELGRSILIGLEFLVAGDICRTVAVTPTLENVAILGSDCVCAYFPQFLARARNHRKMALAERASSDLQSPLDSAERRRCSSRTVVWSVAKGRGTASSEFVSASAADEALSE